MRWTLIVWMLAGWISAPAFARAMPHLDHAALQLSGATAAGTDAPPCHPGAGHGPGGDAGLPHLAHVATKALDHGPGQTSDRPDTTRKALACANLCLATSAACVPQAAPSLERRATPSLRFPVRHTFLTGRCSDPPMEPPRTALL